MKQMNTLSSARLRPENGSQSQVVRLKSILVDKDTVSKHFTEHTGYSEDAE
jgi:hypothetical protein